MDDRIGMLEQEIRSLIARCGDLELRISALEAHRALGAAPAESLSSHLESPQVPNLESRIPGILALAGRLFIVIGGAYLLRALTDASTFSATIGISLGLMYALVWVAAAGLAAAKGLHPSGIFHGIAGSLIAFPLLWEAVTRFRILRTPWDSWAVAVLTAICLFVACRVRFQVLAWLAVSGAVVTTFALLPGAASMVPGTMLLILLGVVTLWIGYELEWKGLRWLVAIAANLAVFSLTFAALAGHPRESPAAALLVQLFMLGLYLASVAVRTVVRARNVIPFEVFQVVAAFVLGFGGAIYTTRATGIGSTVLGVAALVLGAACYGVAFSFMDRQEGRGRNFHFYTSLALLFSLTGTSLLLHGTALCFTWVSIAVLTSWLGWSHSRVALTLHATLCMVAAALTSHVIRYSISAFTGPATAVGALPSLAQVLVLLGAAACIAWPLPEHTDVNQLWYRMQRLVLTTLLVLGIGGAVIAVGSHFWTGPHTGGMDPGILATARTIVLALSALGLTWMGRTQRFQEWGWLLYPALTVTGLKMLFEDFSNSRPATLFIALAAYGCVLILSPRMRRRSDGSKAPTEAPL
jgi:hypothetical protein